LIEGPAGFRFTTQKTAYRRLRYSDAQGQFRLVYPRPLHRSLQILGYDLDH
jgi:hypothetical protein